MSLSIKRLSITILFAGLWLCGPARALSATVEWSAMPNRERLVFNLGRGEGGFGAVVRDSATSVRLNLQGANNQELIKDFAISAPATARLFNGSTGSTGSTGSAGSGAGLAINLKDPAFGYLVRREGNSLIVEFFKDPTGARWEEVSGGSRAASTPEQKPAEQKPAEQKPVAEQKPKPEPVPAPKPEQKPKPEAKPAAEEKPAPTRSAPMRSVKDNMQDSALPPAVPPKDNPAPQPKTLPAIKAANAGKEPLKAPDILPPSPSAQPSQPSQTASPGTPSDEAGQAGQTVQPVQPVQPGQPDQQGQPVQPVQPGQPGQPAQTAKPPLQPVLALSKGQANGAASGPFPTFLPDGRLVRFEINSTPEDGTDPRVAPGSPGYEEYLKFKAQAVDEPGQTPPQPAAPDILPATPPQNAGATEKTGATQGPAGDGKNGQKTGQTGGQPTSPGQPASPAGPAQPAQPAQPGQASQPGQPNQAGQSGQPGKAGPGASGKVSDAAPEENVIYVDEKGNPVPPPPDPAKELEMIEAMILEGEYAKAYATADALLVNPRMKDNAQREQALHRRADMAFALYKEQPVEKFNEIESTTNDALVFNPDSPRNAMAYLRLGYIYLMADNRSQADAYFGLLRKKFPHDASIPLSYYYVAEYLMRQGRVQAAADQYQYIVDNYPDSQYSRDAGIGLTQALYQLGYNNQARSIVTFLEKRWPGYYLEYPPILALAGDVATRVGDLKQATARYWNYYNLMPNAPDIDIVLTRIGDIYSTSNQHEAASAVYDEVIKRFPDTDAGLIAKMRKAENGVYDAPTVADLSPVFERGSLVQQPSDVYLEIIEKHPQSPLVPIARLKLAMWRLMEKKYEEALDQCSILAKTPNLDKTLGERARDVAMQAFANMTKDRVANEMYGNVQELWDKYPIVNEQEADLDPASRMGLATSLALRKMPDKAISIMEPLFLRNVPLYSEMALSLALNIHLENENWLKIEELAARTELWNLTPELQLQLDYALALASENLGKRNQATTIWKKLYENKNLNKSQLAYVEYFLARAAKEVQDFETAYSLGEDSLRILLELAKENPEKADTAKIKTQISMLMEISLLVGKSTEALHYGNMLQNYVEDGSSEYVSLQYNRAKIYKSRDDMENWNKIMIELSTKYPATPHGRMAASALRAEELRKKVGDFSGGM